MILVGYHMISAYRLNNLMLNNIEMNKDVKIMRKNPGVGRNVMHPTLSP